MQISNDVKRNSFYLNQTTSSKIRFTDQNPWLPIGQFNETDKQHKNLLKSNNLSMISLVMNRMIIIDQAFRKIYAHFESMELDCLRRSKLATLRSYKIT